VTGTRNYATIYDPVTQRHWFYQDYTYVYDAVANFTVGNIVVAGGETICNTEDMNYASFGSLQWQKRKSNGTFVRKDWKLHVSDLRNGRYSCTTGTNNGFSCYP
jgi:hypothetical protein